MNETRFVYFDPTRHVERQRCQVPGFTDYVAVPRLILDEADGKVTCRRNPEWEVAPYELTNLYEDPGTGRKRFKKRIEKELRREMVWRDYNGTRFLAPKLHNPP